MKNILVPTDFSKISRSAALYAAQLAAQLGARLKIVNVLGIQQGSSQLLNWKKLQNQMERDVADQAEKFLKELQADSPKVEMSFEMVLGTPIEEKLFAYAKKNKIDLIVSGTSGAEGLKAMFLGTNSAAIINTSDVPVLIVPANMKYKGISRIVLGTDMLKLDKQVKIVASIAQGLDAQIDILHVTNHKGKRQSKTELEGILSRMSGYRKLHMEMIGDTDLTAALNNYVLEKEADLLVMFTHKLGLLEKLFGKGQTRKMSFQSKVPLMVFRQPT